MCILLKYKCKNIDYWIIRGFYNFNKCNSIGVPICESKVSQSGIWTVWFCAVLEFWLELFVMLRSSSNKCILILFIDKVWTPSSFSNKRNFPTFKYWDFRQKFIRFIIHHKSHFFNEFQNWLKKAIKNSCWFIIFKLFLYCPYFKEVLRRLGR